MLNLTENSCVALSIISDSQDCSIGQLRWPLNESNRINGGGGTYFLPDEVSCNGSLVSVHTCFFYNDGGNNRKKRFRLRVGVFRQNIMRNQYIRENVFNIETRRNNSSVTQNCTSMHLPDPLPAVLEGDRLAVHILDGCRNACPLQPNLNISAQTSVFFMPSFNPQWISVNRVMAKQNYINVYLGVSASIGKLIVFMAVLEKLSAIWHSNINVMKFKIQ